MNAARSRASRALLPLAALSLALGSPAAAQKHAMTLADLPLLKPVASPQLSPDGRSVAYVVVTNDFTTGAEAPELVIADLATGRATRTLAGATAPRWSPDGKTLAYRGGRGEQAGIWLYDPARDSSRFLARVQSTDAFLGHRAVKGFEWSPDGTRIAFASADPPGPEPATDVRAYDRILWKTRTSFSDNRLTHLYVVDVAGGAPRQVTRGTHDEHSLAWSPDGARLAFVSNRSQNPDANYSDDVWTVELATGRETQVTRTPGPEFVPAWSPDGRSIAFLGNTRPVDTRDSSPEETQAWIAPATGGPARRIVPGGELRTGELLWDPAGREVLLVANDGGRSVVDAVDVATGRVRPVLRGEFQARAVSADRVGRIAFLRTAVDAPAEVWAAARDGSGARQVSHASDALAGRVALMGADSFWVRAPDGTRVEGWLMKPAGWQPGRKYPVVLSIHGGPHGAYGYAFATGHQLLAGAGYAVLYLNPRGSSGYGQRFADGTLNNWGGGDYADLMAGVDAALAANPWLDGARMGVTGGSYGGYMTNWIVARTRRFRAAVPVASVSDLVSFYGTSLYSDLVETEFNGAPWDNYPLLWQWSPLAHVKDATTPTLFIHGTDDHDVPIGQAEEMYMALAKQGVPAQLVRYPGEGHGIAHPLHVADEWTRILAWFGRYVNGDASPATSTGN